MAAKSLRGLSRTEWESSSEVVTRDDIILGALLRIADATEAMAKSHTALVAEKEQAIQSRNYYQAESERMARRIHALRGVITRFKRTHKRFD